MNTMNDRIEWQKLAPRDRDALVASKVLGWERVAPDSWLAPGAAQPSSLPSFSQHWACALMLAKTIASRGQYEIQISLSTAPCVVEMHKLDAGRRGGVCYFVGIGLTGFPEAMCQAALQSVGLELKIERPDEVPVPATEAAPNEAGP